MQPADPQDRSASSLARLLRDEAGATLALVALSMTALLSMVALVVDLGMLLNTRAEAQRAADAAALAGASAYLEYPMAAQARSAARERAELYVEMHEIAGRSIDPATELEYQFDPAEWKVYVAVRRQEVPTMFARIFGVNSVPVGARAAAEAAEASSAACLKPFAMGDPGLTSEDYGLQVTLRPTSPEDAPVPSFYQTWVLPGSSSGAAAYRENLINDNCAKVHLGRDYDVEPGNMVAPTRQGVEAIIARDPGAYWDESSRSIRGTRGGDPMESPRVIKVPLFDQVATPPGPGRNKVQFTDVAYFFLEDMDIPGGGGGGGGGGGAAASEGVTGRFLFHAPGTGANGEVSGSFVKVLRLVE